MATITGFLNELRNGSSPIRKKWNDGDIDGAVDDYREQGSDHPKLSGEQKGKLKNAHDTGNLQPIQQACEQEAASGQVHVMLWVK
jgi:hypothetical protein